MFTKTIYLNQEIENNQTRNVNGYMILTSRRVDEVICDLDHILLLKSVLMNCFNILKFKNDETSKYVLIDGGFKRVKTFVCLWKTFLIYHYYIVIHLACC